MKLIHSFLRKVFFSNVNQSKTIMREHAQLSRLIELYNDWQKAHKDLEEMKQLLKDTTGDEALKHLASEEIDEVRQKEAELYNEGLVAMLPVDPSNDRNTIVEIRAGAGG